MRVLRFLLEKEFKQILRNKVILPLIFMMPVIQLIILPFAATFEVNEIKLWVVDFDGSYRSVEMVNKICSSGYFKLIGSGNSMQEATEAIEDGKATIILEIPSDFANNMKSNLSVPVWVGADAVNGNEAGIGVGYLSSILKDYGAPRVKPMLELIPNYRFNPELNYKLYMVPGVLVMLITLICGILSALNIVSEKEVGTIEQINVTPVKKQYFILAKLIPFWVIGYIILTLGLIVAYLLYGIVSEGSVLLLYGISGLYMIAFGGFGLLLSTFAQTQQQSMFIAFFFLMIFFLMGGIFTPISSMPHWAQWITKFIPTVYFTEVVRLIILKGSGFRDLIPEVIAIGLFAVVFNGWAIFNYKKVG